MKVNSLVSIKQGNKTNKIYDKLLSVVVKIVDDEHVKLSISNDLFLVNDLVDVTNLATQELVELVLKENERFLNEKDKNT